MNKILHTEKRELIFPCPIRAVRERKNTESNDTTGAELSPE